MQNSEINNWKFLTKEDSLAQGRAFIPPGLWVTDGMTVETEVLDSVQHFFSTRWHQEAPFNNYCPLYSPSITSRCVAGCVAIAGAQMLYYLHNKLGVPETAPTSGQSSGYVYNETNNFSSWGSSSTVWNYMSTALITTTQRDTSAILIADVGKRVGMDYGLYQSSAGFIPLVSNVFNHYGIDCAYNNYQQDTVSSNLLRGLPVLIGAFSDSNYNNGHVFAVDGYKLTRRKDVYHYYWQPNPNYEGVQPHRPGETMEEVFYWQPEVSSYGINWGQNLSNTTMMSLYNSWYRVDGDWYLGSYNYTWHRTMISNFQLLIN